jgi:hypothetical protein
MRIGQQPESRIFSVQLECSLSDLSGMLAEKMADRAAFWKRVWPRRPTCQLLKRADPPRSV